MGITHYNPGTGCPVSPLGHFFEAFFFQDFNSFFLITNFFQNFLGAKHWSSRFLTNFPNHLCCNFHFFFFITFLAFFLETFLTAFLAFFTGSALTVIASLTKSSTYSKAALASSFIGIGQSTKAGSALLSVIPTTSTPILLASRTALSSL